MNFLSRSTVVALLAICQFAMAQENKNQQTTTTTVVVEQQPTTVVEASPLNESSADRLRRQRQENELQTEQRIVEKLEQSRIEDEKRRADRLFGNRVEEVHQMPQQQVVIPVDDQRSRGDDIRNVKREIIEAIKEDRNSVVVTAPLLVEEKPRGRYYLSGAIGTSDYNAAENIRGKGAMGLVVGYQADEHVIIETNFIYSNFYMNDYRWVTGQPIFRELDQYNIGMTMKYSPLTGRMKPYIGGLVSYTYRRYFDRMVYTWSGGYIPPDNQATSNSFDLGLTAGLDFDVTDSFTLGLEYRYSTNMIYRSDSEIFGSQYRAPGVQLVEETDYSSLLISGKVRF